MKTETQIVDEYKRTIRTCVKNPADHADVMAAMLNARSSVIIEVREFARQLADGHEKLSKEAPFLENQVAEKAKAEALRRFAEML